MLLARGAIVGSHLDQATYFVGRGGQEPDARKGTLQYPGKHDDEMVPASEVRTFMCEDSLQLPSIETVQRPGGANDALPSRNTINGWAVILENRHARYRPRSPEQRQGLIMMGPATPGEGHRRCDGPGYAGHGGQSTPGGDEADHDAARGGIVLSQLSRRVPVQTGRQAGHSDHYAGHQHRDYGRDCENLPGCYAKARHAPWPSGAGQPPGAQGGRGNRVENEE
jgi:hypothetical protein